MTQSDTKRKGLNPITIPQWNQFLKRGSPDGIFGHLLDTQGATPRRLKASTRSPASFPLHYAWTMGFQKLLWQRASLRTVAWDRRQDKTVSLSAGSETLCMHSTDTHHTGSGVYLKSKCCNLSTWEAKAILWTQGRPGLNGGAFLSISQQKLLLVTRHCLVPLTTG